MKKAVFISCFGWYEERLEPIRNWLCDRYDVTVLLSDFDHRNKKTVGKQYADCTYIHVPPYKRNVSAGRIISHLVFGKKVSRYLEELQPDAIYLILPPNNTAEYCRQYIKKNPETKYIVDVVDLWPESLPGFYRIKKSWPALCWKRMRDLSLEKADQIIVECGYYRTRLKSGNRNAEILHLFKDLTEEEKTLVKKITGRKKKENRLKTGRIALAYVGSINHIIDVNKICEVVRALGSASYTVEMHIIGDGENWDSFLAEIKKTACELFYYGAVYDRTRLINILVNCDFGLNMMKSSVAVGLTTKSMEYYSMGLPIINSIPGDTWKLVERGTGINYRGEKMFTDEIKNCSYNTMMEKTLDCFEKNFSREHYVGRAVSILSEVLE